MATLFLLLLVCSILLAILLRITLKFYDTIHRVGITDEENPPPYSYTDSDTFSQASTEIGDLEMGLQSVDLGSDRDAILWEYLSEESQDERDSLDLLDIYILDDNFDEEAELVDNFGVQFSSLRW